MDTRDTARISRLLDHIKKARQIVREEIANGASLQNIHDQLLGHEQTVTARLRELREWNRQVTDQKQQQQQPAPEPAETEK